MKNEIRDMVREARCDARRKAALRRARIALYRAWKYADDARPDDHRKAQVADLIRACERTMVAFYDTSYERDDGIPA